MTQRPFQKGIIRENTQGQREILIPVQVHSSTERSHQTYDGQSQVAQEYRATLNELEEWKSKCAHLEDHLDKFNTFIQNYNDLNQEHEELTIEFRDQADKLQETQGRMQELAIELQKVQGQNAQLANQLKKKKQQQQEIQRKHSEELRFKEEQADQLRENLYRLQNQEKKKRKQLEIEITKLQDRLLDLEAQRQRLQDLIERYRKEISALKTTISDLQRDDAQPPLITLVGRRNQNELKLQVDQLTLQLKQCEAQRRQDQQKQAKLRSDNEQLKKQVRQLRSKYEQRIEQLQSTIADLNENIENYQKQLQNLRKTKKTQHTDRSGNKIRSLQQQVQKLSRLLEEASDNKQIERLNEQLKDEKIANKKACEKLEKLNTQLDKKIRQLESELHEQREEITRLVEILSKKQKEILEMQKSKRQPQTPRVPDTDRQSEEEYQKMLRDLKRDWQTRSITYKKQVEQLQNQINELKKRHRQIDESRVQEKPVVPPTIVVQGKSEEEYNSLLSQIEQKDKQITDLKAKLTDSQKYCSTLAHKLEHESIEVVRLLEAQKAQSTIKQQTIIELKKVVITLETKLRNIGQELQVTRADLLLLDQKENLILILERKLLKAEETLMREDERKLYEAKISSKNELIELLSLKLRNLEQQFSHVRCRSQLCFYR